MSAVAPLAGARIEIYSVQNSYVFLLSLPSRERGLKYPVLPQRKSRVQSLPSRERGLKCNSAAPLQGGTCVAPLAGARIEIDKVFVRIYQKTSRSPRGSAD